jgi:hypothetical protein
MTPQVQVLEREIGLPQPYHPTAESVIILTPHVGGMVRTSFNRRGILRWRARYWRGRSWIFEASLVWSVSLPPRDPELEKVLRRRSLALCAWPRLKLGLNLLLDFLVELLLKSFNLDVREIVGREALATKHARC